MNSKYEIHTDLAAEAVDTLKSKQKEYKKYGNIRVVETKVDKTLSSGFRIGVKNGAAFYDYSAESLAQMFSAYLNPKVAGLIQIAAKDAN